MNALIITEHIFISAVTGSKNDELDTITTDIIHNAINQIKSLLVCQSGYNTDHKLLIILWESTFLLKFNLVDLLQFTEIVDTVILVHL